MAYWLPDSDLLIFYTMMDKETDPPPSPPSAATGTNAAIRDVFSLFDDDAPSPVRPFYAPLASPADSHTIVVSRKVRSRKSEDDRNNKVEGCPSPDKQKRRTGDSTIPRPTSAIAASRAPVAANARPLRSSLPLPSSVSPPTLNLPNDVTPSPTAGRADSEGEVYAAADAAASEAAAAEALAAFSVAIEHNNDSVVDENGTVRSVNQRRTKESRPKVDKSKKVVLKKQFLTYLCASTFDSARFSKGKPDVYSQKRNRHLRCSI